MEVLGDIGSVASIVGLVLASIQTRRLWIRSRELREAEAAALRLQDQVDFVVALAILVTLPPRLQTSVDSGDVQQCRNELRALSQQISAVLSVFPSGSLTVDEVALKKKLGTLNIHVGSSLTKLGGLAESSVAAACSDSTQELRRQLYNASSLLATVQASNRKVGSR